jgi:hypothetical protein
VKLLSFISALYVISLVMQPSLALCRKSFSAESFCETECCADAPTDMKKSCTSGKSDSHDCCPGGVCNPFESCDCCPGFSILSAQTDFMTKSTILSLSLPPTEKILLGYSIDCFQPPEIAGIESIVKEFKQNTLS